MHRPCTEKLLRADSRSGSWLLWPSKLLLDFRYLHGDIILESCLTAEPMGQLQLFIGLVRSGRSQTLRSLDDFDPAGTAGAVPAAHMGDINSHVQRALKNRLPCLTFGAFPEINECQPRHHSWSRDTLRALGSLCAGCAPPTSHGSPGARSASLRLLNTQHCTGFQGPVS